MSHVLFCSFLNSALCSRLPDFLAFLYKRCFFIHILLTLTLVSLLGSACLFWIGFKWPAKIFQLSSTLDRRRCTRILYKMWWGGFSFHCAIAIESFTWLLWLWNRRFCTLSVYLASPVTFRAPQHHQAELLVNLNTTIIRICICFLNDVELLLLVSWMSQPRSALSDYLLSRWLQLYGICTTEPCPPPWNMTKILASAWFLLLTKANMLAQ